MAQTNIKTKQSSKTNDQTSSLSEQSAVRSIFGYALESVLPELALRRYVSLDEKTNSLTVAEKKYNLKKYNKIFVVGGGKAARRTGAELVKILGDRITAGILNVYQDQANEPISDKIKLFAADHPTPNEQGVEGARQMVELLKKKAGLDDAVEFVDFRPGQRGNSGRLHQLELVYKNKIGEEKSHRIGSQYRIRDALHEKFLFSSAFVWDFERDKEGKIAKVILQGAGWGHGTGLCQMGALGMALKGYPYEQILKHYYDKTSLKKAY